MAGEQEQPGLFMSTLPLVEGFWAALLWGAILAWVWLWRGRKRREPTVGKEERCPDSLLVEEEEEEEEEEAEEVVLDVKEGLHRTQNANVSFKVHYVTPSDNHLVAVTGSHEALGKWEEFHTLKPNSDGSWSDSVQLPKDARIEWKFVVVENGKILRWEECCNRLLETNHEDIKVYHTWGN
ncbi:starch-binding domain-containing protein 1-like [Latimeria chalumnae]|uniref:Starch-binding domain-containing protein 1 n=1 Tax=Latimeria chalumnae TaxID=7897 RepID=M3XJQ7_LATCH